MFSNNSYAKIKEVETKDNYSICKLVISKKITGTDKYETDFIGKARFVGKANLLRPMADQRIKIISCGVSNCYVKNDSLEFLKIPNYTVFDYELQESNTNSTANSVNLAPIDDSELPF